MPMGLLDYRLDQGRCDLSGELSFDSVAQSSALIEMLASQPGPVTISLAGIKRADSAATAFMVELYRQASAAGSELHFVEIPAGILSVLEMTGLDKILPIAA